MPQYLGISRRTLFANRGEESGITRKTWLKLEAAEAAAGIRTAAPEAPAAVTTPSDPGRIIEEQIALMRQSQADFPMEQLRIRMAAAGAWPPAGADLQLTPAVLFRRYAPPDS